MTSFEVIRSFDVTEGKPKNILENVNLRFNNSTIININNRMGRRSLDLTNPMIANWTSNKPDLIENTETNSFNEKENTYEKPTSPLTLRLNKKSLCNNSNSIPHITGQLNDDLYAVPVKTRPKYSSSSQDKSNSSSSLASSVESSDNSPQDYLPSGWERHEDSDGPYYWHIKSGIIQREPPPVGEERNGHLKDMDAVLSSFQNFDIANTRVITRNKISHELSNNQQKRKKEEMLLKRRSYPSNFDGACKEKGVRFAVRSLGWVEISEEDLTPERSSKAVNKCIVDLSLGLNNIMDAVGRWGDGKDLFMDLDEGSLKLIDPENLTLLNTQPIHTIRVWGVGRDNGRERDFAYVARDRITRKHMCHVFRCDIPARTIANTLRDICKKIMIERSLQQNLTKTFDLNGSCKHGTGVVRPTNLPTEYRRNHHRGNYSALTQSFPTPMEEPKKIVKALYLGSVQVSRASGVDTLNDAIDRLVADKPRNEWELVNVVVAPSTITVSDFEVDDKVIVECRVRYLSFLGIGKDVKNCGFIMHTAQDQFVSHVFHCEPSSGILCKTVEAACKLRYQKCLDVHPAGITKSQSAGDETPNKSISATLKSFIGSFTSRKTNTNS